MKKWLWVLVSASVLLLIAGIIWTASTGESVATLKLNGETEDVAINTSLSISFSEGLIESTVTKDNVQVLDSNDQPVDVSVEVANSNELIIHPPAQKFRRNQSYTIHLSKKVKDKQNQSIQAEPFIFHTEKKLPSIKDKNHMYSLFEEQRKAMKERNSGGFAQEESMEDSADSSAESSASAPTSEASQTNVQVDGVDEADIIKTNGTHTFFVRETDVIIVENGDSKAEVITTLEDDTFYPREIYLRENQLVVIGMKHVDGIYREEGISEDAAIMPAFQSLLSTRIYDISTIEHPEMVKELELSGHYTDSRRVDDTLYLLTNHWADYYWMEQKDSDVRPRYKTDDMEETEPIPYKDIAYLPESKGNQFVVIASLNLDNLEQDANIESYIGSSSSVYMNEENLFMTMPFLKDVEEPKGVFNSILPAPAFSPDTKVLKFSLNDGEFEFIAENVIPGRILNQFSMDERNDVFRIATTTGSDWNEDQPSSNHLYTYDEGMNRLGAVENLAEGERIYSARFMEDRAYMVTFRQVDPLFVINLKDPANPKLEGELKIPGFSNYLHPLDKDHVIGFGQETALRENPNGDEPIVEQRGLKVSLFDISDVTNPVEKDVVVLGEYGHSEMNYNHKAVYWHPSKNLFGIPVTLYERVVKKTADGMTYEDLNYTFEGAYLYEVSAENGFVYKDRITLHDENTKEPYPEYQTQLKRIVSVNDTLYAYALERMKAYDLTQEKVIQTLDLPEWSQR